MTQPAAAEGLPVVLAVDDSADLLALMAKALKSEYRVLTAESAADALRLALGEPRPDLILLDVEMPGTSGFDVCERLKADPKTAAIPVIFLTGKAEPQAQVEGLELGAVDYVTKPINAAVLRSRVRLHVALSNRSHELERLVRERTAQLENARVQVIRRLARAMEMHESAAVGNRVIRLGEYARTLARAAGLPAEQADMLAVVAPLHDIGKLGVPSEILQKPEKLSAPDWERVKRHPEIGAEIIGESTDPMMRLARQIALTHHEHWDGSGYPKGLKGEAIPWAGRLVAIVDAFEAMTTTQFYREPRKAEEAAAEIVANAGKRYDPKLVAVFKAALPALARIRDKYADALGDLINLDFAKAPAPAAVEAKAQK